MKTHYFVLQAERFLHPQFEVSLLASLALEAEEKRFPKAADGALTTTFSTGSL
jgi:hypothetical protein